jgi:hypothetical protein
MTTKNLPNKAGDSFRPNNLETVLSRLEKVKKTGQGKYLAVCPSHEDKSPSLAIKAVDDRLLLHCFAGCETSDVLGSLGLKFEDIMPNQRKGNFPKEKNPFYASEILQTTWNEAQITLACALHMSKGNKLCDSDLNRLTVAAARLKHTYEVTKHGI